MSSGKAELTSGASETLVLACVLSVAGLTLFLAWGAVLPAFGPAEAPHPTAEGWLDPAGIAVLPLVGFAAVVICRRLVRNSSRSNSTFAAGLGLMLLALVVAALLLRGHIGADWRSTFNPGREPAVSVLVVIVACGVGGLMLAALALVTGSEPVRSVALGDAAIALACSGCLPLLILFDWEWTQLIRTASDPWRTGGLRALPSGSPFPPRPRSRRRFSRSAPTGGSLPDEGGKRCGRRSPWGSCSGHPGSASGTSSTR